MLYLAMDTSTNVLTVAVANKNNIIAEYSTNLKKDHALRLMPAIDNILRDTGIKVSDLTGIIVANGPGSYTGLRIGVSTAKAMSWALNIPVVSVSSLSVIARSVKYFDGLIVPIIDARRGQVFTGIYSNSKYNSGRSIEWENIESDRIVLMTDWLEFIEQKLKQKDVPVIFTGNDVDIYTDLIEQAFGSGDRKVLVSEHSSQASRAGELIELGIQLFKSGTNHDAKSLAPEYLRLAEAEYNWLKENSLKSKNI